MRVLYLSPRDSWPPKSGARLRDFHFARALAGRTSLSYFYFSAEGETSQAGLRRELAGSADVRAFAPPAKYTPWKLLKGLAGSRPLPVENYTSPAMLAALEQALRTQVFDVVHLDSIHLAAYRDRIAKIAPATAVMLNWHNIESELMLRYARQTTSTARRRYAEWTARRLERLESALLQSCAGHIVCSAREQNVLLHRYPAAQVAIAENGVDTEYFRPSDAGLMSRLVFVGQMSYHANADGALWFAREVWPQLKSRFGSIQLVLVGSDPGPAIRALASDPFIEVTGTVPDVRPYYAGSVAAIVPLLTGGGTRLKVLEGMAAGVPVISTALGAEGLNLRPEEEFLQAGSDPAQWVRAVERALDFSFRCSLVKRARQRVCAEFDWIRIGDRLVDTYERWAR